MASSEVLARAQPYLKCFPDRVAVSYDVDLAVLDSLRRRDRQKALQARWR